MNFKLINEPNDDFSTIEQILFNRGITTKQDMYNYIHTTDDVINDAELLGEDLLKAAAAAILTTVMNKEEALVIQDCDVDGYTSSATMINYLYDCFPSWVENNLEYFTHSAKKHGLSDCINIAMKEKYKLIIIPDASSNDYVYHKMLKDAGKKIVILDHHLCDKRSEDAIVINNQMCDYPNKHFSGVGIVWQFCRYLDKVIGKDFSKNYLDLLAIGNCGDMMSQLSIETKHIIQKGLHPDNIQNPLIYEMWQKNKYKLGDNITPIGAAFYIVPFVNAITRSGTLEEKRVVFDSMLKYKAFERVPSTKRGHKQGEMERVVDQALRICTNVKNRQTKAQNEGVKRLEELITKNNLLKHKVLLFLLEPGEIPSEIRGLVANKFMAKYQRPCCVLTKTPDYDDADTPPWEVADPSAYSYHGSARGYDKSGITDFKSICDKTGVVLYTAGHEGAFGIGIDSTFIDEFLEATDFALKDLSPDPIYSVDYIFKPDQNFGQTVLDIADMGNYWGKDFDESIICIKGIHVNKDNFKIMKSNTLKITLPNKIDIIKFRGSDNDIEKLGGDDIVEINAICYCRKNEWNWQVNPQLELVDYEIVDFNNGCMFSF